MLLGLAIGGTGLAAIGGLIFYETSWKVHRRRKLERDHARSKRS
jgi:uncharacterized protein (DUF2062 family)